MGMRFDSSVRHFNRLFTINIKDVVEKQELNFDDFEVPPARKTDWQWLIRNFAIRSSNKECFVEMMKAIKLQALTQERLILRGVENDKNNELEVGTYYYVDGPKCLAIGMRELFTYNVFSRCGMGYSYANSGLLKS